MLNKLRMHRSNGRAASSRISLDRELVSYKNSFESENIKADSSRWQLFNFRIKRLIDVVGATICIIALFPLLFLIVLAIKVNSPGPTLFIQQRVGLRGKLFTFLKFRTMAENCDDSVHREYVTKLIKGKIQDKSQREKPLFKLDDDSRVTKFGRFLRAWSLDELPQLVNVLKGDMSLVGPRPPIPYEVENYGAWHLHRIEMKPGITGLWQVKGRSRTTFDEMVLLDIRYIRNWSLWLDFKILLQTFKAIMSRDGAL